MVYSNSHLACVWIQDTWTQTEVHPEGFEDVPLVEFMYLVFTRMPGDVPLVECMYLVFTRIVCGGWGQRELRMHLWWCLCTLYLHACQVRVTIQRMCLWWSLCTLYLHAWQVSYRTRLRTLLLRLFRALINSLVWWFLRSALGLALFQIGAHKRKFFWIRPVA